MNFFKFMFYTFLGCVPWVFGLTYVSYLLGENWQRVGFFLRYLDYIAVSVIFGGGIYLYLRWHASRSSRTKNQ